MSFTDVLPLISAICVAVIGVFVFSKNTKSRINFTFFLHNIAIFIWLFGTFMMFISRGNDELSVFWDRFIYAGVVFIPVFMYHFGLAYTQRKPDFLLKFGYILSILFLLTVPSKYFVDGIFKYTWGVHTKAQLFHHLFLLYFVCYVLIWFVQMFKYYKTLRSPLIRKQGMYIFIAFLLLFSIGPLAYLPAYGIAVYPFAFFSGLIFSIILGYAIIAHRLMDVKFVMRSYSVYILSLMSIIAAAVVIKYIYNIFFHDNVLINLLILVFSLIVFPSIKNYFYRFANKYFFSSLYDTKQVIESISEKLRSTLDVEKIYEYIYETLSDAFHIKSFGLLTYEEKENQYYIKNNQGFEVGYKKTFEGDDDLHNLFIKDNKAIIIEELKHGSLKLNKHAVETIEMLKKIGVEIMAPLNVKDKTIGLIVLGPKESGDMYNDEDLQVLKIVGAQTAIALENALLYGETKDFNIKLKAEVKRATRELVEANEKLKILDRAKSDFISIASHQLRTPLTVIKGYISMMLEGSFGALTKLEQESLTKVFESNERLIQLVENLLNLSRIESGRLQYNFEKHNLANTVDSVVDELTGTATSKGLKLKYKAPAKSFPESMIDIEKIRQVVMNLIDNAIKYTKKGTVSVSLKQEGDNIEFCVSDTGMGMDQDDIPNLFKRFSRGKGTALVHTEGTGLGLYVARKMVEAHDGKIWAESPGRDQGSKFCFTMPIK